MQQQPTNLQAALEKIEQLVEQLQDEQLPLEDALLLYAQATELVAFCQTRLQQAKLQIETLSIDTKLSGQEDELSDEPI